MRTFDRLREQFWVGSTGCDAVAASQFEDKKLIFVRLRRLSAGLIAALCLGALVPVAGVGQATGNVPATAGAGQTLPSTKGAGGSGQPASGREQSGASKSASGAETEVDATAPAPAPPGPTGRPRIGLALAGGGALAMSEIGVLRWMEEHHIPVDMIAGTSMGALVGALYATGKTPDQLQVVMNTDVFGSVFRVDTAYKSLNFRRREDSRELPNGITAGLKHGVTLRNSVLTDQGLNAFFDREFYRYDDRSEFNTLPIPFRCIATDLTSSQEVTFARGSIPDAVRASVSLPGFYRPFAMNGHEYVDGGVLDNLPTKTLKEMKPDVMLAVSIPLQPVSKGELDSILGVLQRSFSVAIEANEEASRKLADVVMLPDLTGFSGGDYLKTKELAAQGYAAAEQNKTALLKYAVNDAQWAEYLRLRAAKARGEAGNVLRVRVLAPDASATHAVQGLFQPLVNKPMNTGAVEGLLAQIRSDGRYDADYTVAYEAPPASTHRDDAASRPTILVTVTDKKTGPPFLVVGVNAQAETSTSPRAAVEAILRYQDLGGYGSELRGHAEAGWLNRFDAEYFRRLVGVYAASSSGAGAKLNELFVAPRVGLLREPFYIYRDQVRLSERQLQTVGGGVDLGWTNQRTSELRLGWQMNRIGWQSEVGSGSDGLPDVFGSMQKARVRYAYDSQDRGLVPQYGMRFIAEAGYLYDAAQSRSAPQITVQGSLAHKFGSYLAVFSMDSGTMLNRDVAQPFRFTLGGPAHLSASAIDEYRGTDYFLVSPAFLRRIASLPAPLGQSIYVGAAYEAGQMRAPDARTVTRQDVYFGVVAETPLGVILFGPAIGDDGHRKLVFSLGKLF